MEIFFLAQRIHLKKFGPCTKKIPHKFWPFHKEDTSEISALAQRIKLLLRYFIFLINHYNSLLRLLHMTTQKILYLDDPNSQLDGGWMTYLYTLQWVWIGASWGRAKWIKGGMTWTSCGAKNKNSNVLLRRSWRTWLLFFLLKNT